jgi:hypothetical protein
MVQSWFQLQTSKFFTREDVIENWLRTLRFREQKSLSSPRHLLESHLLIWGHQHACSENRWLCPKKVLKLDLTFQWSVGKYAIAIRKWSNCNRMSLASYHSNITNHFGSPCWTSSIKRAFAYAPEPNNLSWTSEQAGVLGQRAEIGLLGQQICLVSNLDLRIGPELSWNCTAIKSLNKKFRWIAIDLLSGIIRLLPATAGCSVWS